MDRRIVGNREGESYMKYRKLGSTDVEVSCIALGCWGFAGGSMWGDQEEKTSIEAIHAALDVGMTFLDTAEAYGDGYSEQVIGKALGGRRGDAIIATKARTNNCNPESIAPTCEASLGRLQTDYIDLYQLHWPSEADVDLQATEGALIKLVQEGKIRNYGVCNYGPNDMARLSPDSGIVSNQLAYSILFRAIEYEIAPLCGQRGVSILTYSSLLHGLLSGKYRTASDFPVGRGRTRHFSAAHSGARHGLPGEQELTFATLDRIGTIADDAGLTMVEAAIGWVLRQGVVASVLAGARDPDQVAANAKVGEVVLADDTYDALNKVTEELKTALGPNADMWQPTENSRIS